MKILVGCIIFFMTLLFPSIVLATTAPQINSMNLMPLVLSSSNISKKDFMIPVSDFSPWGTQFLDSESGGWSQSTIWNVLASILEKLIVVFWVIAALMMTIGAGYMIVSHGDETLLGRGKSIFTGGIISLVLALGAGLIVSLFAYLLY